MTEHTRRLEELDKTADLCIWKIQFTEQDAEVQKSLEMASKPSYVALDQGVFWAQMGYRHGLWNHIDLRLDLGTNASQLCGFGDVSECPNICVLIHKEGAIMVFITISVWVNV